MSSKRRQTVVAALAVLFAGLTNAHAHVHLCFDGQQPQASLHGGHGQHDLAHGHDFGHDHHFAHDDDHDDLDIDVEDRALAKSFKPDLPAIAAPAVAVFLPAERSAVTPIAGPGDGPGADPPFLRPLSRAPPDNLA